MNHLEVGKRGEDMALEYLLEKGMRLVEKNFWMPFGEIDLVMKDKEKRWIFVEVKTLVRRGGDLIPEDEMTRSKVDRFKRVVEYYIRRGEFEDQGKELEMRLDLVAVQFGMEGDYLTNKYNHFIKHYEGI